MMRWALLFAFGTLLNSVWLQEASDVEGSGDIVDYADGYDENGSGFLSPGMESISWPGRRAATKKTMKQGIMKQIRREVRDMKNILPSLTSNISFMELDVRDMNRHFYGIAGDVRFIKNEVMYIKRQAHVIWENVTDTRRDHKRMNKTLWWILNNVTRVVDAVDKTSNQLSDMTSNYGTISDQIDNAVSSVAEVSGIANNLQEAAREINKIRVGLDCDTTAISREIIIVRDIMNHLKQTIVEVRQSVVEGFKQIDYTMYTTQNVILSNFSEVNAKVSDIGHNLMGFSGKMNEVWDKMNQVGSHMEQIRTVTLTVGSQMSEVRENTGQVRDKMLDMSHKVGDVGRKIDEMGQHMGALGTQFIGFLGTANDNFAKVNTNLKDVHGSVKGDLDEMKVQLKDIRKVIADKCERSCQLTQPSPVFIDDGFPHGNEPPNRPSNGKPPVSQIPGQPPSASSTDYPFLPSPGQHPHEHPPQFTTTHRAFPHQPGSYYPPPGQGYPSVPPSATSNSDHVSTKIPDSYPNDVGVGPGPGQSPSNGYPFEPPTPGYPYPYPTSTVPQFPPGYPPTNTYPYPSASTVSYPFQPTPPYEQMPIPGYPPYPPAAIPGQPHIYPPITAKPPSALPEFPHVSTIPYPPAPLPTSGYLPTQPAAPLNYPTTPSPLFPSYPYPPIPAFPSDFPSIPGLPTGNGASTTVGLPNGPVGPGLPIGCGTEFIGHCACLCPCECTCPAVDPSLSTVDRTRYDPFAYPRAMCHCLCTCPCRATAPIDGRPMIPARPDGPIINPSSEPLEPTTGQSPLSTEDAEWPFPDEEPENNRFDVPMDCCEDLREFITEEITWSVGVIEYELDERFEKFKNEMYQFFDGVIRFHIDVSELSATIKDQLAMAVVGIVTAINELTAHIMNLQDRFTSPGSWSWQYPSRPSQSGYHRPGITSPQFTPPAHPHNYAPSRPQGRLPPPQFPPLRPPLQVPPNQSPPNLLPNQPNPHFPPNQRPPSIPPIKPPQHHPTFPGYPVGVSPSSPTARPHGRPAPAPQGKPSRPTRRPRPSRRPTATPPGKPGYPNRSLPPTPRRLPSPPRQMNQSNFVKNRKLANVTMMATTDVSLSAATARRSLPPDDSKSEKSTKRPKTSSRKKKNKKKKKKKKKTKGCGNKSKSLFVKPQPSVTTAIADKELTDPDADEETQYEDHNDQEREGDTYDGDAPDSPMEMPNTAMAMPREDSESIERRIDPFAFHSMLQKHINHQIMKAVRPGRGHHKKGKRLRLKPWRGRGRNRFKIRPRPLIPMMPGFPFIPPPMRPPILPIGIPIPPIPVPNPLAIRPPPMPDLLGSFPPGMMVAGMNGSPYSVSYNDGKGNSWNVNVNRRNNQGATRIKTDEWMIPDDEQQDDETQEDSDEEEDKNESGMTQDDDDEEDETEETA